MDTETGQRGGDVRARAEIDILRALPGRRHDLARLRVIAESGGAPVVTVVGKYNHGKSRLLNELIGGEAFGVADRRETFTLAECLHEGVRWLDAPGLDADVDAVDDRHARDAAWLHSDVRLMVHAAKEGELDADERMLLHDLHIDGQRTRRQTLLVLSQVDQLADDEQQEQVTAAIRAQQPDLALYPVSSVRHYKGVSEGKRLLTERSGIPTLRSALADALARVPAAREHETCRFLEEMDDELRQRHAAASGARDELLRMQAGGRSEFDRGLQEALEKVSADILEAISVAGPNLSEVPDSAADRFRMTAGKQERARLQIAYSRACMHLGAYLTGQGVIELPAAQRTAVNSLNTVMVAVLGVSVKYREDLHRIFCVATGRENLQRQFAHYYELSSDRVELRRRLAGLDQDIEIIEKASKALHTIRGSA